MQKVSPRSLLALGVMLSGACGQIGPSAIEMEPTATPDYSDVAAAACGAWINEAQTEMNTFKDGLDAAKAQIICTVDLADMWGQKGSTPLEKATYIIVDMHDNHDLPINDTRGYPLALMLQDHIIVQLKGTPTPSPAPLTSGE